jgi:ubiquinone/menaquinone biosynthesis C-methylase UbiE
MERPRVDYDCVAPGYNRRFVGGGTRGVAVALGALAGALRPGRILEVGCGTGHWLAGLAADGRRPYGLDLSAGMLARAVERGAGLRLVRGRAGRLPFVAGSMDLIYCVNAIHHFDEPRGFVHEAARLLCPGGRLAVIGSDPRAVEDGWYVYDYFPGTYETDLARFPPWDQVRAWLAEAGFREIRSQTVEKIHDPKVGRAVLDDPFLVKEATSQLTLLSDDAYARGLARIRQALDAAEARGETLTFEADLTMTMVSGVRDRGGGR